MVDERTDDDHGSLPDSDLRLKELHAQPHPPPRRLDFHTAPSPHARTWGVRALVLALVGLGLFAGFVLRFRGEVTRPNAEVRNSHTPVRLDAPVSRPSDSASVADSVQEAVPATTGLAVISRPVRSSTSAAEEDGGAPATVVAATSTSSLGEEPLFRATVNHQGAPVGGGRFALTLTLTSLSGESLELHTADAQIRTASGLIAATVDDSVQLPPGERISVPLEYDIPADASELHLVVSISDHEVVVIV